MRIYPRTKFADKNNIPQQMEHIMSEIEEFRRAWAMACYQKGKDPEKLAHALREMAVEAHDMGQSVNTLLHIIQRDHPELDVWGERLRAMTEKNRARNYYAEGGSTDGSNADDTRQASPVR